MAISQNWCFGNFYHSRIEVLQIAQLLALVIFVSDSLVRENLRGLRENFKHKIRTLVEFTLSQLWPRLQNSGKKCQITILILVQNVEVDLANKHGTVLNDIFLSQGMYLQKIKVRKFHKESFKSINIRGCHISLDFKISRYTDQYSFWGI